MKKLILPILGLLLAGAAFGQSFQSEMAGALNLHEIAKTPADQLKGLESMEALTKKYPNEWLPNFWAAYQCTQMNMLKGKENYPASLNPEELLDRSEKYLGAARDLAKTEITDRLNSDFHALQSLIYDFRQGSAKDKDSAAKLKALSDKARKKALALSPDSPVMKVFVATEIGRKPEATYAELVAAIQLMKQAKETFDTQPVRAITTSFNQEWIQFWLPWLDGKLKKIIVGDDKTAATEN